jgi:hypothetical protein
MRYWLLFTFLAWTALTYAQEPLRIHNACSFAGRETEVTYYQFDASREADSIVGAILTAVSLEKNFVVKSSNCNNALATVENGRRYILYNTTFLEQFKRDARSRWAAYGVFAHEIGHHLQGHNFAETDAGRRKLMELEADKFAGGVLRLLGACLDDAQAGVSVYALAGESSTHPSGNARREAVASGWKKQDERPGATPCAGQAGAAPLPGSTEAWRQLSGRIRQDVQMFEDKLKNIVNFLPSADRMFEYPEAAREYNGWVQAYNAARDSVFAHRQAFTAEYRTHYLRDEDARAALADWYRLALDDIHERFLVPLNRDVQSRFSELEKEKINPNKARKTFRQNWAAGSGLYQNLERRVKDLEEQRRLLMPFLKGA